MKTQQQNNTEEEKASLGAIHQPVLLEKCVDLISPALQNNGSVGVDCTLGIAGHTQAFLAASPQARIIGIDRDEEALGLATERLAGMGSRFIPVHASFNEFDEVLNELNIETVNAVFMDLGLSSLQIDHSERGFSYNIDGPLDMRMDKTQDTTAASIVANYSCDDLTNIFRQYGEEKYAYKIANSIVKSREKTPYTHTQQIVDLVDQVVPRFKRPAGNPAKRVFQALRIEVNGELAQLAHTLPQIASHLAPHGRIVIESYHSLEDKIVKGFFSLGLHSNVPQGLPVIPAEQMPYFKDLTHGAIQATEQEKIKNSRSSSVRLRGVELVRPLPRHSIADFNNWEKQYFSSTSHPRFHTHKGVQPSSRRSQ